MASEAVEKKPFLGPESIIISDGGSNTMIEKNMKNIDANGKIK